MLQARYRHLALALEGTGTDNPYRAALYEYWDALLRDLLERLPGPADSDFTAHALLAATRADLVEYLAGKKRVPREEIRRRLAGYTTGILGNRAGRGPATDD